jgi:hypothetical protein
VTYSLKALEAGQSGVDDQLGPLEQVGEVMTSIDPTRNAVVIDEAAAISAPDASTIQQAARASGVKTMVLDAGVSTFHQFTGVRIQRHRGKHPELGHV